MHVICEVEMFPIPIHSGKHFMSTPTVRHECAVISVSNPTYH